MQSVDALSPRQQPAHSISISLLLLLRFCWLALLHRFHLTSACLEPVAASSRISCHTCRASSVAWHVLAAVILQRCGKHYNQRQHCSNFLVIALQRKASIEAKNEAETQIYSAESSLREYKDKLPQNVQDNISTEIANVRSSLESEDAEEIRSKV